MFWVSKKKVVVCLVVTGVGLVMLMTNNRTTSGETSTPAPHGTLGQGEIKQWEAVKVLEVKQMDQETHKNTRGTKVYDEEKVRGKAEEEKKQDTVTNAIGGNTETSGRYIPPRRVVHLDMKGAPPKLSYLRQLIPLMASAGATDLLVEYEDMFPYWGPLHNISALNAYSKKDVESLLQLAADNKLGVIPLVQTFGHLEFVLKLEEFRGEREVPGFPQSMCPSQEAAWATVAAMVDQIMEMHPASTHIHIGCDEVFQLGLCPLCTDRLSAANTAADGTVFYDGRYLFLQHVARVARHAIRGGKTPIIWDDMLRNLGRTDIMDSGIGELVEPMVWVYIEDIDRFIDAMSWRTYAEVFKGVWTASAYKGAFGERLYIANMLRHAQNHLSWMEVMARETKEEEVPVNFRGIALTGWSRYDHFAVLCELLPVAVPSLVLNLVLLSSGGMDTKSLHKTHELLHCTNHKTLMNLEELRRNPLQWDLYRCNFPGVKAFSVMSAYNMNRNEVDILYDRIKDKEGWMTDWNVNHRYSSPWRVQETMKSATYLPGALRDLDTNARKVLALYIDRHAVEEWVEQNILPLRNRMEEIENIADTLTKDVVWPRRPV